MQDHEEKVTIAVSAMHAGWQTVMAMLVQDQIEATNRFKAGGFPEDAITNGMQPVVEGHVALAALLQGWK
jgi:copper oxidase (laccase) domain-containing protein